jgi:hypothetical protein
MQPEYTVVSPKKMSRFFLEMVNKNVHAYVLCDTQLHLNLFCCHNHFLILKQMVPCGLITSYFFYLNRKIHIEPVWLVSICTHTNAHTILVLVIMPYITTLPEISTRIWFCDMLRDAYICLSKHFETWEHETLNRSVMY